MHEETDFFEMDTGEVMQCYLEYLDFLESNRDFAEHLEQFYLQTEQ
ncbi:MAG: hypothetical protein OQL06_09980 [Gammaproteobacteria bacterium]|nr:hypothetical protein [Gammaproteobacteria bacterium]